MSVKPSESKALIPAANTPICPKVIRLFIEHPTITDRIVSSIWNEDGSVTDAFKAAIGLTVGGLAAPTNVAATDGTYTNKITITWSPSTGASSYTVWRNTVDDSATATQVGSPSATTLDDSSVTAGTVYWYWVKAVNAGGTSAFSTSNNGYAGASASSPIDYDSTADVTVPAGWSTVKLEVWAGGGAGGGINAFASGSYYGGGGGGSGEYRVMTGVVVTAGQVLNLVVGTGGVINATSSGASGLGTAVSRSSTILISAVGGGGGGVGGASLAGGAAGAAGSGGTGGTSTPGNAGQIGQLAGSGGTGGAAVGSPASWGAGGVGRATQTAGGGGHVRITPNG